MKCSLNLCGETLAVDIDFVDHVRHLFILVDNFRQVLLIADKCFCLLFHVKVKELLHGFSVDVSYRPFTIVGGLIWIRAPP